MQLTILQYFLKIQIKNEIIRITVQVKQGFASGVDVDAQYGGGV